MGASMKGITRKVVMIAGTFDLLHPGHVHLIHEANSLGDVTAVIGTDTIVKKLKGKAPIIPERQRRYMIENLKGIKHAVIGFSTTDFSKIIKEIKPDIILMGPDQQPSNEKMEEFVQRAGAQCEIRRLESRITNFSLTSTTGILERIKHGD
ncbi:adenylyltransferase/cytidyltransferase family protein [Candidatus Bathyarchaeota archaeon]|nr:adenylyltransferase/cytidyltransferase family protein [Candidatus Bathyarchaeota archaeon]